MICAQCVLEEDAAGALDADGVCWFCSTYPSVAAGFQARRDAGELELVVDRMKRDGAGRAHDCVLGISGGVDSSYLAYQVVQLGLRPLVIHLDNGWDSELAIGNIDRLVNGLGLELETHVIDWREFRALQVAYFRASVIDIEVLTDHAITAFSFQMARGEGIKYLISGMNIATEWGMPATWNYAKQDLRNLKAIARRFGGPMPSSLPTASGLRLLGDQARGVRSVDLLNLMDYNHAEAVATLERELGWRSYGGKHYESLFTRFYQAYVLPTKFGVDKRRAHLSSLIRSGQRDRDGVLRELEEPLYEPEMLRDHRAYVLKKLGFSDAEFDAIMAEAPKAHTAYPNDRWYYTPISKSTMAVLNSTQGLRKRLKARREPGVHASAKRSSVVK